MEIRDEIAKLAEQPLMVKFGHMAKAVVQEEMCKNDHCESFCKAAQRRWHCCYLLAWHGYTRLN